MLWRGMSHWTNTPISAVSLNSGNFRGISIGSFLVGSSLVQNPTQMRIGRVAPIRPHGKELLMLPLYFSGILAGCTSVARINIRGYH